MKALVPAVSSLEVRLGARRLVKGDRSQRRLIDGRRRGAGQHQRADGIALEREPIEVGDVSE